MFKYLEKYGNISWEDRPICNVDLAEFSQLIYNPFENIENESNYGQTLRALYPEIYKDGFPPANWSWPENVQRQWKMIPDCSRFADVRLDNFHSIFKPELDEQFAAATFGIGQTGIVVFRGTDLSIVGWKEDLDMGYRAPLPCHHEAVKYLENELPKYDQVYVVGQSKGGHLAVYSSACVKGSSNIVKVLSLEGPGLDKATYEAHWNDIKDKVEILLPQNSIIGMTLGYGGNYSVVKSRAKAIMQHDPFSWTTKDGDFITDELSLNSIYFHRTLHDFVEGTSDEDRETLVKIIFRMADSLDVEDVDALKDALFSKNIKEPISVLKELDDEERAVLTKLINTFRHDVRESAKLMVTAEKFKFEQKIEEKKEKLEDKLKFK